MIRISRADYDKPYRCPGWSGSGWSYNKHDWCDDRGAKRWSRKVYYQPWRLNAFRRTRCCNTIILPIWFQWFEPSTWAWELEKRKMKYGTDIYGRYAEDKTGERFAVEFYPFWRRYPWRVVAIISQAYYVLRWKLARKEEYDGSYR